MKRVFKSFTFYFLLLSLIIIYINLIGRDSKNILLIYFNPLLNELAHIDSLRDFLNSGPPINSNSFSMGTTLFWYIGNFITCIFYGLFLDGIKLSLKKLSEKGKI
ncbi:MAG: hypothetical protein FH753_00040 [Firmicutes bacterium]|nr:hypothetical protein [Bacillota bacterium]